MKSKKILVASTFLILLSLLFSGKVFAVEEYIDRETRLHYKVVGDEITISGVDEKITKINIPQTIDGKTVTTIGRQAFLDRNDIVSITLPDTVKIIEDSAFANCENLTEIKFPDALISLGGYSFKNCKSLKEVEIPCNLEMDGTFDNCTKLEKVIFTNKVTNIGNGGYFGNCISLQEILIPNSVTYIGEIAFSSVNSNFTIYGDYNSYIRQYCEKMGLKFVATRGQPEETQEPSKEQEPSGNEKQEPKTSEEQKSQEQQNKEQKTAQDNNKNNDTTIAPSKLPKARIIK